MGQAVPVRTDYTASEVRRFARRAKDGAQARRLLALAAVLDGASREEAAKIGGMDRQTLRDWVIRYNEQGPDGLINIPSPGAPPKLDDTHKAFLRRLVDEGPIPAIHGVVRWRACDLIVRLHDEFGLSVSDDTICYPRRTCHSHSRPSRMARRQRPQGSQKHHAPVAAAACARAQPSRKYLAVHAGELAVKPHLQILRRHRRPLLLRLEHAHRPALENHVHRSP